MKKNLYALALIAMKFDPEVNASVNPTETGETFDLLLPADEDRRASGGTNSWTSIQASAWLAYSHEEARERGVEMARERWPEADGWIGHQASATMIHRDALIDAIRRTSDEEDDDDEESPEAPSDEPLM